MLQYKRRDQDECGELFAMRRTGEASRAMQRLLGTEMHLLSHTQDETDLFKNIRHEYRIMEMFDAAALAAKTWAVLYENKNPYDSGLMRNVICRRECLDLTCSIYMHARLCAPATHAICLLWAVEYMPAWCPNVSKAYVLEEIDTMSRYVMLHFEPGIVTMYKTVVAFVKLSVLELHEGGSPHVGISIENMPEESIARHRQSTNTHFTAHIRNIVVCVCPLEDELYFEISVLHVRRTERVMFAYIHDCIWTHFVMPWIWSLGVMATKTAMLDRSSVCLESWIRENTGFFAEIKRKVQRAAETNVAMPEKATTATTAPQQPQPVPCHPEPPPLIEF